VSRVVNPLESLPIFAGCSSAALDLLAEAATACEVKKDEVVIREGEIGNRMFLMLSGSVRIYKQHQTPLEAELARLTKGDFFGEMCILDTLPRSATVVAEEDTSLLVVSSMAFHALYTQMPAQYGLVVLNIARDLSRRLRKLDSAFGARA